SGAGAWGEWLRITVDKHGPRRRIVLTDSSSNALRRELLAAEQRFDEHLLEPLTFREFLRLQSMPGESDEATLGRLPNPLARYLALGGFPEHVFVEPSSDVRNRLRVIPKRSIYEDLATERVDQHRVERLFVYLAESSGNVFDPRKIASCIDPEKNPDK